MMIPIAQSISVMPAALCAAASTPTTVTTPASLDAELPSATQQPAVYRPDLSAPAIFYNLPPEVDESTGILANAITALRATKSNGKAVLRFSVGAETLSEIATFLSGEFSVMVDETVTPVKSMTAGIFNFHSAVTRDWIAAQQRWYAARKVDPAFKWNYLAEARLRTVQKQALDEWLELGGNQSERIDPKTLVLQAWGEYKNQQLLSEIRIQFGVPSQSSGRTN